MSREPEGCLASVATAVVWDDTAHVCMVSWPSTLTQGWGQDPQADPRTLPSHSHWTIEVGLRLGSCTSYRLTLKRINDFFYPLNSLIKDNEHKLVQPPTQHAQNHGINL